jgi:hypothetical protein
MTEKWLFRLFTVKMYSLDTLFYVRIKLNYLNCEIPPAPLFERGETSLAHHFLQLPPFAKGDGGGFSCVGATNIQVMIVYERIIIKISEFILSLTLQVGKLF